MPPLTTPDPTFLLILPIVGLLVFLGLYVWYGFALSRLFPKLGAEGWKGWVPILNEVVILDRGGVPGWSVAFYFLPLVSLYGLYLKAKAMHSIGQKFQQNSALVIVGFFLPPLWAMIVTHVEPEATDHFGKRIQGMMMPMAGAAVARGPLGETPEFSVPAPAPVPVPAPAPEPAPTPEPEPVAAAPLAMMENPWAPASAKSSVAVAETGVVYPTVPEHDARSSVAELPTIVPSQHPGILDSADDDLDRTVAVDRRPIVRWSLITDSGVVLPLKSDSVLLGRKPVSSDLSVEPIAVPDESRTLSKNHARLELRDGLWTVTDLNSTNGVILVSADGAEVQLPAGGSSPLAEQFILGNVILRLVFENGVS